MRTLKKFIKKLIGQSFKSYAFSFKTFNGRSVILMYHRVADESLDRLCDPAMFITPDTLEMHIREISSYFDIVPLEDIWNYEKPEKRLCAITFDDGWRDNYDNAYPILKKYNIPATIFLTVNMIGTQKKFWFHSIWEIANKAIEQNKEMELIRYFSDFISRKVSDRLSEEDVCELISNLKDLPANEIEDIVLNVYEKLDFLPNENIDLLDWKQAHEMGQHRITFGSHSLNHYILPRVCKDIKKREIFDSLNLLKNKGVNVTSFFCYPNGNWDNESCDFIKEAGYRGAVTTRLGYNQTETNPFLLNRIAIHDEISNSPSLLWFRIFQCFIGTRSN